jgi:hypothetical protein
MSMYISSSRFSSEGTFSVALPPEVQIPQHRKALNVPSCSGLSYIIILHCPLCPSYDFLVLYISSENLEVALLDDSPSLSALHVRTQT